ncbi:conserved Plasmodium protein, unknown function [Plasmodium knowlesi strain H]|uniref:Uncharacterized protein n=3 Tax=Plasmodium knowlesi TaxID=5850 RepID=A0A5K1UL85_PLAKH|nr:conserved protein, unknown function [Plasmodium knowlesi strain H]OTN66034.1 Uncharacterized protein PKNOH_S100029600 [Plasmodium knowlesi]CAA9987661.1 conserved protein, unknown function [Plasmodium knowlesi strain H]SBO26875.1 conserved Plasmodium protein, unknown function [Plasmodium knowlesi strain H]SBO29661.1 conserved Plasmodium protein, unknown function [Plasmodium knowlesi strain H]VVS77135.1 conserved protein, unknown function [Plasmodium knowlesi strain H]|eukprot:XP_002258659.1 hypothetical protein, conserved in Plasmodium species [Plasmodium knowlesi strain H]
MENSVRHSVDIKSEDFVVLISLQNLQTFIMIGYTAVNKEHLNFDFSYLWALCIGTGLFIYSLISFVLIRSIVLSKIDIGKYVLELLFSLSVIVTCSLSIIIDSFKIANMQLLFFSFALTGYAYYNLISLFFFCTLIGMIIQYNLSFTGLITHSTSFFFLDLLCYLVQIIGGNILYFRMYELCTVIVISKRNPCKYVVASKEVKSVEKQIFSSLFNSYMCIKSKTYSDLAGTNDILNKESQSVLGRDTLHPNSKDQLLDGTFYQDKVNHTNKLLLGRTKRDKHNPKGADRLVCGKYNPYHNSQSLANSPTKHNSICTTNFKISNTLSLNNNYNSNLAEEPSTSICKKCASEKNNHKDNACKQKAEKKKISKSSTISDTENNSNKHWLDPSQLANPNYSTTTHGEDDNRWTNNSSRRYPQDDQVLIPITSTNTQNDFPMSNSNSSWIKSAAVIDMSGKGKRGEPYDRFEGHPIDTSAHTPSENNLSSNSYRNRCISSPNEEPTYYQTHFSGLYIRDVTPEQSTHREISTHSLVVANNTKMDNQKNGRVSNKGGGGTMRKEQDPTNHPTEHDSNGNDHTYYCNLITCPYNIIKGTHYVSICSGARKGDMPSQAVEYQRVENGEIEVIPRGKNAIQAYPDGVPRPRGRRPSAHSNCTDHLGDESRQNQSKFESTLNDDASDILERTLPEKDQPNGQKEPTQNEVDISEEGREVHPKDYLTPCTKEINYQRKHLLNKSKSSRHVSHWGENTPHRHTSRCSKNTKLMTFTNRELQSGSNSNSNCKYSKKNSTRQHEMLDKIVQLDISNQDHKNKKKKRTKDASLLSLSSLYPLSSSAITRKKKYFTKKKKKKYTSFFWENPKIQYLFVHIPQYFKNIFDMTKKIFSDLKKKKVVMQNAIWKNKIFIPERDSLGLFKNAKLEKCYVSWMDEFNRNIITKTYYISIYLIIYIITLDFVAAYNLYYTTTRRMINGALRTQYNYVRYYFFKSIINIIVYLVYILFLTFTIRKEPTYNIKRYYFVTLLLCFAKLIISSSDIYVVITSLDYFISPYYVYIYIHMLIVQTSILLIIRYPTHYLLFFLYVICFTCLYWSFSIHKCFMEFIFIIACISFTIIYSYVLCSRTVEINRRILFSKYELPYLLYLKEIAGCINRRRPQGGV